MADLVTELLQALEDIVDLDDLHMNEARDCECAVHTQMAAIAMTAIRRAQETPEEPVPYG